MVALAAMMIGSSLPLFRTLLLLSICSLIDDLATSQKYQILADDSMN